MEIKEYFYTSKQSRLIILDKGQLWVLSIIGCY